MSDVLGVAHRNEVVRTRRGYGLMSLGLLVPGSAQAVAGNNKLGRFALKLWLIVAPLCLLILILTLLFRNFMIGLFANGLVLQLLAVCIFAIGVFWALLAVNTWWISRPDQMGLKKGMIFTAISLVLTLSLTIGTVWVGTAMWTTGGALSNIFTGGGNSQTDKGRYNILLLGSDSGPGRWGMRPDSIMLASVNGNTGRTALFSFPRNLEEVPFAEDSPLHALYPNGYGCDGGECLLNSIYLLGVNNAELYPGVADPGMQAMIDAITGMTGLPINYYIVINMQGFIDLIDAMGGLTMTIHQRVPYWDVDNGGPGKWIEAGENRHLTGYETLWFARSRSQSSDFGRMERQRCVIAAMAHQLDPTTVATKFFDIATATSGAAVTSMPPGKIGDFAEIAMKARSLPILSIAFTPPLIHPGYPDFELIRSLVEDTIAQSEALDEAAKHPSSAPPSTPPTEPGEEPTNEPSSTPTEDGNVTNDLNRICSVN